MMVAGDNPVTAGTRASCAVRVLALKIGVLRCSDANSPTDIAGQEVAKRSANLLTAVGVEDTKDVVLRNRLLFESSQKCQAMP